MLMHLFLACAGSSTLDDTSVAGADSGAADTDPGDTDSGDTEGLPDGLNGTAPAAAVALPTFTVSNQHGDTRTEADLLGHPTVLWFYPAAGTYG